MKKYVDMSNNIILGESQKHICLGDTVVVVDGSYMINEIGNPVLGIGFQNNGQHELLTVTNVNTCYPTYYLSSISNVLGKHNNCEITAFDTNKYYCSAVNIRKFESKPLVQVIDTTSDKRNFTVFIPTHTLSKGDKEWFKYFGKQNNWFKNKDWLSLVKRVTKLSDNICQVEFEDETILFKGELY